MNKKGISPLLATVLLIGFAIAIAVLIYFWYTGIIKQEVAKQGCEIEGKNLCTQQVEIQVSSVQCTPELNTIRMRIENRGQVLINDFRLKIRGKDNIESITFSKSLNQGSTEEFSTTYDSSNTGTIEELEVFPVVVACNSPVTCSQQSVKLDCQ